MGVFASEDCLGILTHNTVSIEENVTKVFEKWFNNRGSIKSQEEEQVISHVQELLEQNGNRLAHVQHGRLIEAKSYSELLGVVHYDDYEGASTYYLHNRAIEKEILKGFDINLAKQILKRKGILELDRDGSNKKCPYEGFKGKRMVKLVFRDS